MIVIFPSVILALKILKIKWQSLETDLVNVASRQEFLIYNILSK